RKPPCFGANIAIKMAHQGEDLEMTVIICIAGVVVGLIVAAVSNWLVLPMVLKSQERQWRDPTFRLPLLGDARRVRAPTIAIYRYLMPLISAVVGAVGAYYLFIAPGRHPLCWMSKGMSGHRSGADVNVRYWPLADMEAHVRSLQRLWRGAVFQ